MSCTLYYKWGKNYYVIVEIFPCFHCIALTHFTSPYNKRGQLYLLVRHVLPSLQLTLFNTSQDIFKIHYILNVIFRLALDYVAYVPFSVMNLIRKISSLSTTVCLTYQPLDWLGCSLGRRGDSSKIQIKTKKWEREKETEKNKKCKIQIVYYTCIYL